MIQSTSRGTIRYLRHAYVTRQAFDNMLGVLRPATAPQVRPK
jgi:hypothetical protein